MMAKAMRALELHYPTYITDYIRYKNRKKGGGEVW